MASRHSLVTSSTMFQNLARLHEEKQFVLDEISHMRSAEPTAPSQPTANPADRERQQMEDLIKAMRAKSSALKS